LDFGLIKANPKIFSGMSDITTFHVAFLARSSLVGLHQTDAVFGFGVDMNSKEAEYEMNLFFKVTKRAEPLGLLPSFTSWEVWREGIGRVDCLAEMCRACRHCLQHHTFQDWMNVLFSFGKP
jgi:muramoyltetrapeptide carboxypeptidase LdcA involved in peptidoglycan recycling